MGQEKPVSAIQYGYMRGRGVMKLYLAQNLKYLREKKGLNQHELAAVFGLTDTAIGHWERCKRTPDIEMIIRLAEYFNVSLDDFILRDLKPPEPLYARNLRFLRTKHGMAQDNMANLLGYRGKQGYGAIETGKVKASVDDLEKLSDFFGVTMDQLVKQDLSEEG